MTSFPHNDWFPEMEHPQSLQAHFASAPLGEYPWDETNKPPVILWNDFQPYLRDKAVRRDEQRENGYCFWPWIVAAHFGIEWSDPNQGSLGTCAGFAADTASWCMLLQHLADGIELQYVHSNPYPAWVLGREDARYRGGGASMAMVLNGINKYGRFPVTAAGTYGESIRSRTDWRSLVDAAEPYQAGCCYLGNLSSRDMAEAIMLSLRAGHPVAFGGSTAVSNKVTYINNVKCGILKGSWMHATAFVAFRQLKGKNYIAHMNSWGSVYGIGKHEGDPGSVVWLSEDQLFQMCSGRYRDAFVITYAESAHSQANWNLSVTQIPFPKEAVR